jgi:hypothetical protein
MEDLLTHRDSFTEALAKAFEMDRDEAAEVADAVLARFEGQIEVDDDTLDADLRSVFYTLEAKRMLSFRRVEYTRDDGDRRRAFYWKLRLDQIDGTGVRGVSVPVETEDVYASLPAAAWHHAHAS